MAACQAGDVSIVRELLEAGLDPNGVDNVSEGFRKFIDMFQKFGDRVSPGYSLLSVVHCQSLAFYFFNIS